MGGREDFEERERGEGGKRDEGKGGGGGGREGGRSWEGGKEGRKGRIVEREGWEWGWMEGWGEEEERWLGKSYIPFQKSASMDTELSRIRQMGNSTHSSAPVSSLTTPTSVSTPA